MNELTPIEQAVLDLGLEDLIALPEVAGDEEILPLRDAGDVDDICAALVNLLRLDRIQVWSGHWTREPEVVDQAKAEVLLQVKGYYDWGSPESDELRVFYVNTENLRV
jgi:hypothetical protein